MAACKEAYALHFTSGLNAYFRCCVLVGQMKTALLEIRGNDLVRLKTALKGLANNLLEKFRPDRIIIECS